MEFLFVLVSSLIKFSESFFQDRILVKELSNGRVVILLFLGYPDGQFSDGLGTSLVIL